LFPINGLGPPRLLSPPTSHLAVLFVTVKTTHSIVMGAGRKGWKGQRGKRCFSNFASNVSVNWTHQLKSFVEIKTETHREREKETITYRRNKSDVKSFSLGDCTIYSPKCPAVSLKYSDLMRCCKGICY
jgi:hypothetical protein